MRSDELPAGRRKTLREYAEARLIYQEYQRLKRQVGISRRDIFYFLAGRHWEEAAENLQAMGAKKPRSWYVV